MGNVLGNKPRSKAPPTDQGIWDELDPVTEVVRHVMGELETRGLIKRPRGRPPVPLELEAERRVELALHVHNLRTGAYDGRKRALRKANEASQKVSPVVSASLAEKAYLNVFMGKKPYRKA